MDNNKSKFALDNARLYAENQPPPRPGGGFVLYWMQATMRARGNHALAFAIQQANDMRLSLLVYQGLRHDYPWASDRIHTFILESVADLVEEFADRGIPYAFHLDRTAGARAERSPLLELADRAALVVTDWAPTFLFPRQLRGLRRRTETPVVAVDSLSVIPIATWDRTYITARALRPKLEEALPHHLHLLPEPALKAIRPVDLPFEPVVPTSATIPALVASCDIDHTVPPAPGIPGGPRAAEARLEAFIEGGLSRYVDERNDPLADASSRLSPYLHFGNIAIQEVLLRVREAGSAENYAKFQDEALTWRELAHQFVARTPHHCTLDAIPAWARRELEDHSDDPRPALYDPGTLESGGTDDALWNACQRALVRDGELHNWLRMLWGKSVLQWTRTPDDALRILEHLNHKYALDGRDANSYGGILWCFGLFDRPFYRRPIYGTVRFMSTKAAWKKFDAKRYVGMYDPEAVVSGKR